MSKEIKDLSNTINLLDLVDIYKILHQKHSFQVHTKYILRQIILEHKTNLNKFKGIQVIQYKF